VLHGALFVPGVPDAEAHLLERVRAVFGSRPLAVTVDFHANLSHRMVALADVVVGYKTYPHVDPYERAREAYALLTRMLRGEVRPISHLEKPPLLTVPPAQRTDSRPMRDLIARAREMEQEPGVLSATVTGGFPYADEERAGMGCLVITEGDSALARRLAEELRDLAWENRHAFAVGEGGSFSFAVGGKTDGFHGAPVKVDGKVRQLTGDGRWRYIGVYMTGQPGDMGRAALVRSGGVDLVITEKRITPMDRGYLERLGIDAQAYRIHVVKGAIAWQTGFGDLVQGQIYVDGPGICTVHLDRLPFRHLRRPVFPLDSF
jgi:microcystin degradation protein MlrC